MAKKLYDTVIQNRDKPESAFDEFCLVMIYPHGKSLGKRFTLTTKPYILGRDEACDIVIADASISRRHARLEPIKNDYFVLDMNSTNGTYVNEKMARSGEPIRLNDGDYLRLGSTMFRYLCGGNVEVDYHEEIYKLTIQDALTQIANVRYFEDFLEREIQRTNRHHRSLTLCLFDIDHFKKVNDTYGHLAGDYVLRELAQAVREFVRREDLFARTGGEEFALVLVETEAPQALDVAERVRKRIEEKVFRFEGKVIPITVSMGIAAAPLNGEAEEKALIAAADACMYRAKELGRNRVVYEPYKPPQEEEADTTPN
ncbi:MAG: GGDEF domain-containing protein [Zavarzinella sp.]